MQCPECGADLPGEQRCLDQFHALLAAEAHNEESRRMHGLTVLTYHLLHPSLTKPWYQLYGADVMPRIFGLGEDWGAVLLENHPRGVGRQRSAKAIADLKARGGSIMPGWVNTSPISGELTAMSVDPFAPTGQSGQIMAWARSVAEHRFPESPHWNARKRSPQWGRPRLIPEVPGRGKSNALCALVVLPEFE